jgi:hypothetical protein
MQQIGNCVALGKDNILAPYREFHEGKLDCLGILGIFDSRAVSGFCEFSFGATARSA